MVSTLRLMKISGLMYERTWYSIFYSFFVITSLTMGAVHFGMKAIDYRELGLLSMIESVHYGILFSTWTTCAILAIWRSSKLRRLWKDAEEDSGAFIVEAVEKKRKRRVSVVCKALIGLCAACFAAMQLRVFAFKQPKTSWEFPVEGWVPWRVDGWATYTPVVIFQLVNAALIPTVGCSLVLSYVEYVARLCARFQTLVCLVELASSRRDQPPYTMIRSIVRQHNAVIRFYEGFQEIYSPILLCLSVSTGLMLCTIGYVITVRLSEEYRFQLNSSLNFSNINLYGPLSLFTLGVVDHRTTLPMIFNFLMMSFIEIGVTFMFCWFGEQVTSEADKLREAIYFGKWYEHPIFVQKAWLVMSIKCQSQLVLTGGIQQFNLKGFSEMLQVTYSYFNMLAALRGNESK